MDKYAIEMHICPEYLFLDDMKFNKFHCPKEFQKRLF
jgi:hypothetical protein